MKLHFIGTRQEFLSFLRVLCLIEGDKRLVDVLEKWGR